MEDLEEEMDFGGSEGVSLPSGSMDNLGEGFLEDLGPSLEELLHQFDDVNIMPSDWDLFQGGPIMRKFESFIDYHDDYLQNFASPIEGQREASFQESFLELARRLLE